MHVNLRYDLRAPDWGVPPAELYAACLEQSSWADAQGFQTVTLSEHHGSDDGYCPSPLVMAAAVAAVTTRIRICLAALVLPLHDPVRVAEDAAVVDLISGGRLEIVAGAGYREEEFAMFGRAIRSRPSLMEHHIGVLRRAWAGEEVEVGGASFRVTPRPLQQPGPPLYLGGASEPAAVRAARLGDGFLPTMPGFESVYLEECARLGREPVFPTKGKAFPGLFVHVTQDPERDWPRIMPHALHEMNSYGAWLQAASSAGPYDQVMGPDELKASGLYHVLTPEQLVDRLVELGPDPSLTLHPLMGGLPPDLARSSLDLVAGRVVPEVERRLAVAVDG